MKKFLSPLIVILFSCSPGVNDYFQLQITSYEKGIVNGSFNGTAISDISPPNNPPPITITNGVLKNIKLIYFGK